MATAHELYINDILVDVDDQEMAMRYQSMLFTSLQSVFSNHSWIIKLPKTAKNLRAIEHTNLVDIDKPRGQTYLFGRRKHRVRYYRNGLTIFEKGFGTLIEINEKIEFSFAWGNIENFGTLMDHKLPELSDDTHIAWNGTTPIATYGAQVGFPLMDFGMGTSDMQYMHPAASANWILDRISADTGITIEGRDHFKDLYVPLLTRNSSPLSDMNNNYKGTCRVVNAGFDSEGEEGYTFASIESTTIQDTQNININGRTFRVNADNPVTHITIGETMQGGKISGTPLVIKMHASTASSGFSLHIGASSADGGSHVIKKYDGELVSAGIESDVPFQIRSFVVDESFDMSGYSYCFMNLLPNDYTASPDLFSPIGSSNFQLWIWTEGRQISFGEQYPVIPNLPDMTYSDFFKALLHVGGLFAYPKANNTVGVMKAEDLMRNKSRAYNWTDKLDANPHTTNEPQAIQFALDNFAQNNLCLWDNDDEVKGNTTGVILSLNETVEKQREAIKLPFSASNNTTVSGTTVAMVPVYTKNGEQVEYEDGLKARLLRGKAVKETNKLALAFEQLDFKTLIQMNYSDYQRLVIEPKVIMASCILTDYDLSILDLTIPVYFEQYGRYYAILKVDVRDGRKCRCEFLELPMGN